MTPTGSGIPSLPANAALFMPHKPPMLLIDRLLEAAELESVSEMTVREGMVFVGEDGVLDAAAYAEIIAQSLAAMEGFLQLSSLAPVQEGFLLGVRKIELSGSARVGDTLRVSVWKVAKYGDFGVARGEIRNGDVLIARGEVKVWQRATT